MKCFVIMPFSDTTHSLDGKIEKITSTQWTYIFNNWIKKAVESYPEIKIACKRSEATPGNFVKGIIREIYDSNIVITDLTGQKPNVYYELGIRHALRLGTVIITQSFECIPSDLRSYYCFQYKYSALAHEETELYANFEKDLHEKIGHVVKNPTQADSPVSDFLNFDHFYVKRQEEKDFTNIMRSLNSFILLAHEYIASLKLMLNEETTHRKQITMPIEFFNFGFIQSHYTSFLSYDCTSINNRDYFKLLELFKIMVGAFFRLNSTWQASLSNINAKNIELFFSQARSLIANLDIGLPEMEKAISEALAKGPYRYEWVNYSELLKNSFLANSEVATVNGKKK